MQSEPTTGLATPIDSPTPSELLTVIQAGNLEPATFFPPKTT